MTDWDTNFRLMVSSSQHLLLYSLSLLHGACGQKEGAAVEDGGGGLQSHAPMMSAREGFGEAVASKAGTDKQGAFEPKGERGGPCPGQKTEWAGTLAEREGHSCALCMSASSLISSFPSFPARPFLLAS